MGKARSTAKGEQGALALRLPAALSTDETMRAIEWCKANDAESMCDIVEAELVDQFIEVLGLSKIKAMKVRKAMDSCYSADSGNGTSPEGRVASVATPATRAGPALDAADVSAITPRSASGEGRDRRERRKRASAQVQD